MSVSNILEIFIEEQNIEFHRFNSWKHCYKFFQEEYFAEKSNANTAALHLGFYLASWGMYRGSTFLLQKDYTIHINIVKYLKENYLNKDYSFEEINILKNDIVKIYKESIPDINVTDTLVTKILLGTYACIPAYDRFFQSGLKINKKTQKLSNKSFIEINNFYNENKKTFEDFEAKLKFPKMKLLDMYFWKIGFDKAVEEKLIKEAK